MSKKSKDLYSLLDRALDMKIEGDINDYKVKGSPIMLYYSLEC